MSALNDEEALMLFNNVKNEGDEESEAELQRYLMSRGARDCSMIVSLLKLEDEECHHPVITIISFG